MRKALPLLALAAVLALATSYVKVEGLTGVTGLQDYLQYDDGTPYWLIGGVAYYGTWFDIYDFVPEYIQDFWFDCAEWWFYHHPDLPWDTDMISLEIWHGDATMPDTQMVQNDLTALHLTPVYTYHYGIKFNTEFWTICNTAVHSSTGSPTAIYDNTLNFTGIPHTFGSDDWILWEPFVPADEAIDVLLRAMISPYGLDSESWGGIKGLYR